MNIPSSFDPTQPARESTAARPANLPANLSGAELSPSPAPVADGDTASISAAAVAAASGVSDVRTEKVAAIQQALANGSYSVSPTAVADKLIDHMLRG